MNLNFMKIMLENCYEIMKKNVKYILIYIDFVKEFLYICNS